MPNRYVRQTYIESESVNSVSLEVEAVFIRLIVIVDDWGRCEANIRLLRPKLFPLRLDQISENQLSEWITECERVGSLRLYSLGNKEYLQMMKWEKGRAEKSKFPEPPPEIANTCLHLHTTANKRLQMLPTPTPTPTPSTDSDSGSDRERPELFPEIERPSVDEVKTYAQFIGLAEWRAVDFFDEMEGCNWKDYQNREIRDWRAVLRRVKTKWESDGRPTEPPSKLKKKYKGQNI